MREVEELDTSSEEEELAGSLSGGRSWLDKECVSASYPGTNEC